MATRRTKFDAMVDELGDLGYAESYEKAEDDAGGVVLYDAERAYPGLNLIVPAHEPRALLIDMQGEVVHEWYFAGTSVPGTKVSRRARANGAKPGGNWRRVALLEDGGLIAIFEGQAVIRIDKDSNLIWSHRGDYHHDLDVLADGSVVVLSRDLKVVPRFSEDKITVVDTLTTIDAAGKVIGSFSLLEAFEKSAFASVLDRADKGGDIFHTNAVEVIEHERGGKAPVFTPGKALISLRTLDLIAVVDLTTETVEWTLEGMFLKQHDPDLLANGNLLVFDNLGHHGVSKVVEFDPFTKEIHWSYEGDETNDFFSRVCGASQRLANGNTLITESTSGRAFEVTPDGTVVWHYDSPFRIGPKLENLVVLMDVMRVAPAASLLWL